MTIITHEQVQNRILFSKIVIGLLIAAMLPIWPYFYYQFLRLAVFGAAAFSAYLYDEEKNQQWMLVMIVIAIVFNPVMPLYLDRQLWTILNLVAALLFFKSPK